MRYQVVFEKRSRTDGEASAIDPTLQLDSELPDGVLADKNLVEWIESDAQHSQEALDEDDAFLGMASVEVWEYEVFAGRDDEFKDAIKRSKVVLEYTLTDETDTLQEDAIPLTLKDPQPVPAGVGDASEAEGPAAHTTGDPSAGGTASHADSSLDEGESLTDGGRDDMHVTPSSDPELGFANDDWAADTGPARAGRKSVGTRDLTDKSSTLRPEKK